MTPVWKISMKPLLVSICSIIWTLTDMYGQPLDQQAISHLYKHLGPTYVHK